MNTKKLIGMIIGVTLFAALIAGATFAWLTYDASTQNATKNIMTRSFTFTSPTGTNLTNTFRTIANQPARNTFTAGTDYIVLSLSKGEYTPWAQSVKIILKKPTNGITLANVWRYAICRSGTASQCNNSVSTAIPSSTNVNNWVVTNGAITTGTAEQVLWEDTACMNGSTIRTDTGSPFNVITAANATTSTTYYVYFWLDASIITTANLSQVDQKQIIGNIYFEAVQGSDQTCS